MSRVDLHIKILDEQVVQRAKRYGLDVLVYAPHFTRLPAIRERARAFSDDDLLVVPAR
ncbi:MAG TPA: PHP domain-containing protein, partial [Halococcus sp.]|nr:PHP domain-containing protein [Halococcus sp.]